MGGWFWSMVASAWHVLVSGFDQSINRFSTSRLALSVLVAAFIFPHIRTLVKDGFKAMWPKLWKDIGLGGALVIGVWLCLIVWSSIMTIYKDHSGFVEIVRNLRYENRGLRDENTKLSGDNKMLINRQPATITRFVPPPEVEKRCWVSDYAGFPNSTVPGAVTATAAIIHCNYKIEAPFRVAVEFDRDFLLGATVFPDSGIVMGRGSGKRGRVSITEINSPSLLTGQLAIVTVYGLQSNTQKLLVEVLSPLSEQFMSGRYEFLVLKMLRLEQSEKCVTKQKRVLTVVESEAHFV